MLKLVGELSLAALSIYAVRKPAKETFQGAMNAESHLDGFARGAAAGALVAGSVVAAPITAPVGAAMFLKDCYQNRTKIMDTTKALPQITKDKINLARAKISETTLSVTSTVSSWFTREHREKVAAAPSILIVAVRRRHEEE